MKLSIVALLAGSAAAYTTPTMTFAVGKKPVAKQAPVALKPVAKKAPVAVVKKAPVAVVKKAPVAVKAVVKKAPVAVKAVVKKVAPKPIKKVVTKKFGGTVPSKALPFENAPAALDGSLPGDVGFDPCFLSTKADLMADYFNGLNFLDNPGLSGIEWYREIELIHGRIAQMAVLGFIFPGFTRIPGLEDVTSNPVAAISETPYAGVWQVIAFMGFVDLFRINRIRTLGKDYTPGDFGWGQGEGRFNPFGFNYSPAQYYEKQVQETKHGRLAMIALIGLVIQANVSGVGVLDQLSPAFSAPGYFAKAGYYFPDGI